MRTQILISKCCRCQRIQVNSNWIPEPDFLSKGIEYTHTYCPVCLQAALAEANTWAAKAAFKIEAGSLSLPSLPAV